MKETLIAKGWLSTVVVGCTIVDSKYLLAHGIKQVEIDNAKKELKYDLDNGRVKVPDDATEQEKRLLNPECDEYVEAFEGQHRSASIISKARRATASRFSGLSLVSV